MKKHKSVLNYCLVNLLNNPSCLIIFALLLCDVVLTRIYIPIIVTKLIMGKVGIEILLKKIVVSFWCSMLVWRVFHYLWYVRIRPKMQEDITNEAINYLTSLRYKDHKDNMSAEMAGKIKSLCETPELISTFVEQIARYCFLYMALLIRIYYLSIDIFILFLIFTCLFGCLISLLVSNYVQKTCDKVREVSNYNLGIITNYLDNILNVKLYGSSQDRMRKYPRNLRNASVHTNEIFWVLWTLIAFFITLTTVLAMQMLYKYQIPQWKELMSVILAVMPLFFEITHFAQVCMNQRAEVGVGLSIFNTTPEEATTVKFADGSIEMRNVSMKYPQADKESLKNISFKIKSGQKVGIVGHSGAGKSTLFSLLMKIYSPTEGDIFFGGVNLQDASEAAVMKELSVVLQNSTVMYDTSIMENLHQTNINLCREICKKVHLDEIFMNMKDQYDTVLTSDIPLSGVSYSGSALRGLVVRSRSSF